MKVRKRRQKSRLFVVDKLGKLDYVLKSNKMNILKEKFASYCFNLAVDNSAVSSLKIVITIEKNIMLLTRLRQDAHPG